MADPYFSNVWNTMNEVNRLREDATNTAYDILHNVQENYVTQEEVRRFETHINNQFDQLNKNTENFKEVLETISNKINDLQKSSGIGDTNQIPHLPPPPPSTIGSTKYDLDFDVIMKNRYSSPINQVPDPGLFYGDTKETELFCQICEDTFRTYPNKHLLEEAKINFVQSRLRGAARNWYLTKYKQNIKPNSMAEILGELKKAFPNTASNKLAKIKMIKLKQSYGKINDYMNEFRSYSQLFNWNEEALALIFYNGLHPKYQEEINKMEIFPTTLESIFTKCILFEETLNFNNKLNNFKDSKHKSNNNFSHGSSNNFDRNKNNEYHNKNNNKNYYNKNYNNNYKNNTSNNNNNNNNFSNTKTQKINTKN